MNIQTITNLSAKSIYLAIKMTRPEIASSQTCSQVDKVGKLCV